MTGNGGPESSCLRCLPGKFQTGLGSPNENYCMGCEAGKFQSQNGAFSCMLCDAGKFSSAMSVSSSTQCQSCSANFFSAAGSASCSADCPAGTFPGSGMRCENCDSGKYLSYRGSKNPSECLLCSAGTYSTASGVSSINTCQFCQVGYFSNEGAEKCMDCGSGMYQTGIGASSVSDCKPCDHGKYSRASNASAFSECVACDAGSYCAIGCSVCLNCSVGTYHSSTGGYECTACSKGTYSNETGGSSIDTCKLCHAGSYSYSNSSTCTQCLSGTFSTALGHPGPCSSWKSCQLFIEIEDDLQAPSSAADRVCLSYQYNPPRAAKLFIFFGQFPLCCLICFMFLRYAPRCMFTKTKIDSGRSPSDEVFPYVYGYNSGGVLSMFNARETSWCELKQRISNSLWIAPVHKSLIGAFHDFVVGVHDVVSDCSLLLLVANDAPGFFFKNVRGDLFYMAVFAVSGSIFVDLLTAGWCGEIHLIWLYIASCTDILPSRRGKVTYINKILKIFIASVPVWIVQSVFIYQTYMKYQADKKTIPALNQTLDNNQTFSSAASNPQDQNSDWWIDYGIVFLSFLGTLFNVMKNFSSLRRMLQYNWNHVQNLKLDKITDYVELELAENRLITKKNPNSCQKGGSCISEQSLHFFREFLKIVLFISPPPDIDKSVVHMLHQPSLLNLSGNSDIFKYLKLKSLPAQHKGRLNFPVFADFHIKKKGVDENFQIRFLYALEMSGEIKDSLNYKWWNFWKWFSSQSLSFEIREYYASKNDSVPEGVRCATLTQSTCLYYCYDNEASNCAEWVSNEKHNLLVHQSKKGLHEAMFDLSLLQLIRENKTPQQVIDHYDSRGFELMPAPDQEGAGDTASQFNSVSSHSSPAIKCIPVWLAVSES